MILRVGWKKQSKHSIILIDFFLNKDDCYIYLVCVYLLVCEEACACMGVVIRG